MTETRMPTTLPSPVDRQEFLFVAVDPAGAVWAWSDHEMVWVLVQNDGDTDVGAGEACVRVH